MVEGLAPPTRAVAHSQVTICRRLRIQYVFPHMCGVNQFWIIVFFAAVKPANNILAYNNSKQQAYISAIKSSDDQVTTNPVAINEIFKGFYTNLYKVETDFDEPICKQYLDKLELPRISQMNKVSLEAPLSMEKLHVSLKSLQKG